VENLLGEVGRGHIIAFNILNIGRLRLAGKALGQAKDAFQNALNYSKQRRAFGKPIAKFGLIQEKIAEMAARIFVAESMVYRTAGLLDAALQGADSELPESGEVTWKAIEEYAIECSINKVYLTELLAYVVDEVVQIFGGYGYHQDYPAERAYRDARISRIYEGTNEINRLVIASQLLRRGAKGRLALFPALKQLLDELDSGSPAASRGVGGFLSAEKQIADGMKKAALLVAAVAHRGFGDQIANQQELLSAISDIVIEAFAMESAILRAEKISGRSGDMAATHPCRMTRLLVHSRADWVEGLGQNALAAISSGNGKRLQLAELKAFLSRDVVDVIGLRRDICHHVVSQGNLVA
jgi:butyryl-CoA dehydrogenase